ncbi:cyclin-c [Anaeramoeba flamelloides]|uniref:Cyclin-c n=1 Tax=Anaeramoeba flamelloides TaxID=1746091 RepID=A0AAV7Z1G6_9EUKA|nr:cyclin-c [Anaeramoeba flamelloides]KAJ6247052.1 cyclin-c [Anaeramoeba flamelloides]
MNNRKLFCDYDPWLISPACLFLATKTEEYIMVSNYFLTQVKKQFHWKYTPNDFFSAELQILEALNYDLIIFHAYKPLLVYTEKAELDENCIQCAWSLLNGTYSSNLCLQYHPYMIALSCLFLAALNTENDVTGWFSELNISIEDLKSISEKILKIHQQIEQSLNDKHHYEKNVTQILNKIKKKN